MRDELLALSFPARRPLSLFALIFFLFALALPITAATTKAVSTLATNITSPPAKVIQSSANQVALIELYTSEGCSSCPPADAWLTSLKTDADLWKRLVPVDFHVYYWSYLGWDDGFAKSAFSHRQRYVGANSICLLTLQA